MPNQLETRTTLALVTRAGVLPREVEQYLQLSGDELTQWTTDPTGSPKRPNARRSLRF
jgi:hypothetical protein